jgi:endonuclease/exonuclease/phosphatase family metal-dependent hydrolase
VHFVVAGDFNCQSGSRFYNIFIQWAKDLNLQLSDIKRLDNALTYTVVMMTCVLPGYGRSLCRPM